MTIGESELRDNKQQAFEFGSHDSTAYHSVIDNKSVSSANYTRPGMTLATND